MKLNKILRQIIHVVFISIITSCSYFQDVAYNENIQSDQSKYNLLHKKKPVAQIIQSQIQKLQANNTIYFSLDQYNIDPQFFNILNIHTSFLCNHPLRQVKIEGHADERGTPEYNIALGERRANSVKLYLQSQGVSSEQIFIVSYGKEKPAVFGHNEQAYSKNRRAVLTYQ